MLKLLLVICAVLALVHSPWWWIGVGVFVLLDCLDYWQFYHAERWRKIHFPMMRIYARCVGVETGVSEHLREEFKLRAAVAMMVKAVRPAWDTRTVGAFIDRQAERLDKFEDCGVLAVELRRRQPKLDDSELTIVLDNIRKAFSPPEAHLFVRFMIAGIIEEQYGERERVEYLYEVVHGRAI